MSTSGTGPPRGRDAVAATVVGILLGIALPLALTGSSSAFVIVGPLFAAWWVAPIVVVMGWIVGSRGRWGIGRWLVALGVAWIAMVATFYVFGFLTCMFCLR
jgi:hypothetical protein